MGIRDKINILKHREDIVKKTKYKVTNTEASQLVGTKKEKLYSFYKCDYCDDEIRIEKKFDARKGGIVIIPNIVTKMRRYKTSSMQQMSKSSAERI